jgi:hypothetical protein
VPRDDDNDILRDPQFKRWARDVLNNMAPKLRRSDISISLCPSDGGLGDVKFWVELGASIMYDKPVIVVVPHDQPIPEHLQRVADEIVRVPADPKALAQSQELLDALQRVEAALDAKDGGPA